MGCDIHCHAEVRKHGIWVHHDWRAAFVEGTNEDGPNYNYDAMFEHPLYIHRSYNLFAILANVRNGVGFAGIKTGEGFRPISLPRDLPTDVTEEVRKASDGWGEDGHSHSWLTLAELDAFDWQGQSTILRGWVDAKEYQQFKVTGAPETYCGDIWGTAVKKVTNSEMSAALVRGEAKDLYTMIQWQRTYAQAVGSFLTNTLPALRELGKPEDVRLVFWFDN